EPGLGVQGPGLPQERRRAPRVVAAQRPRLQLEDARGLGGEALAGEQVAGAVEAPEAYIDVAGLTVAAQRAVGARGAVEPGVVVELEHLGAGEQLAVQLLGAPGAPLGQVALGLLVRLVQVHSGLIVTRVEGGARRYFLCSWASSRSASCCVGPRRHSP